jgi:hypothetical protein
MKKIKSYKTFEEKSVNLEKNNIDLTQKIVEMNSFDKKMVQSIVDKLLVALQSTIGSSTEKDVLTDKASEYLNKYWGNLHDAQTKKFVEENRAVIIDQAVKQLMPDDED